MCSAAGDSDMAVVHWQAVAAFATFFVGYPATASAVQYLWYVRRRRDANQWKSQPQRAFSLEDSRRAQSWWLPVISTPHPVAGKLAPFHRLLPTVSAHVARHVTL